MQGWTQGMPARLLAAALLALLALLILSCASNSTPPTEQVPAEQAGAEQTGQTERPAGGVAAVMTGRVVWQGGDVQLPDGAVLTVTLADTSIADASWTVISQQIIENPPRLPAAFRLEYDPTEIDERSEYSLSASVDLGDRLLYTNDTVHTVLTRGSPAQSDIEVIAVR